MRTTVMVVSARGDVPCDAAGSRRWERLSRVEHRQRRQRRRPTIRSARWSAGSTSSATRPPSRASRSLAIAGRAPSATARRSTGSKRSSRATAVRPSASKYEFNPRRRPRRAAAVAAAARRPPNPVIASGEVRSGPGGSRYRGTTRRTGVNNDPNAQPDEKLRELNREPTTNGPREQVYCTKVGTTRPERDVHRRRAHGRPRLGRSRQRQRIGHGAGDGAGAHLQHAGRADRAHDSLCAVEQRRDRPQRRARLRRAARSRCRARRIRRDRAAIRSRSGSA